VPPDFFNNEQRRLWFSVLAFMPQGLIAACDGPLVETFVFSWWTQREARRQINEIGLMVRSPDGAIRNPLLGIARGASADMHRIGGDLGLSPLARTRLIDADADMDDPIELLLGEDFGPEISH
jgi:P27 family predicted phage terminase small subunit